jgi:hypothetical protein
MFRAQKTLKKTKIKLYNALALPALLYGSENWTIKGRDERRITTPELKYMYKKKAGYTWADYKTNTETAKELNVTLIFDKVQEYRRNWFQHIYRIPCYVLLWIIKKLQNKR